MKLFLHVSNFDWKLFHPKNQALGWKGIAFHLAAVAWGVTGRARKSSGVFARVCTWAYVGDMGTLWAGRL